MILHPVGTEEEQVRVQEAVQQLFARVEEVPEIEVLLAVIQETAYQRQKWGLAHDTFEHGCRQLQEWAVLLVTEGETTDPVVSKIRQKHPNRRSQKIIAASLLINAATL
jgi:hypothetical protein